MQISMQISNATSNNGVLPCVTGVMVFDFKNNWRLLNWTATCIKCIHTCHREYARLEVSIGDNPLKFVCLW